MKFVLSLFATALVFTASQVNAVSQDLTGDQIGGTVASPLGDITFSPSPADAILWGDNEFWNPQDPANIELVLETAWGIDLTLATEGEGDGGLSGSIAGPAQVFYLHAGDNAVAFGYAAGADLFEFSGLDHGFSNFRTFSCTNPADCGGLTTTNEVPVPGAALLFGTGLMGIAGVARKRRLS